MSICSVIIPTYNAEATIEDTLKSLELNGRWRYAVDVYIIDDGSEDRTEKIVEAYLDRAPNMHYCKKENGGVSSARNRGIELAKSKYIFFLDADDLLMREGLEAMIEIAERTGADCVISSYYRKDMDSLKESKIVCPLQSDVLLHKDYIEAEILRRFFNTKNTGLPNLWNKLYAVDRIRKAQLRFNEAMTHGEDWLFNIRCMQQIETVYITDCPVLTYRVHTGSGAGFVRYRKALAYSLLEEFRVYEELNQTYHYCADKDEDYLLFIGRSLEKTLALLRLQELTQKEKKLFINSKEEQYLFRFLSRLNRKELAFLGYSRKDRLAFRLVGSGFLRPGLKILLA